MNLLYSALNYLASAMCFLESAFILAIKTRWGRIIMILGEIHDYG